MPEAALSYLKTVEERLSNHRPRQCADRIRTLVREAEAYRRCRALNLLASENIMSRGARALLDSDLATRGTEGFPGAKWFPPARENIQIDEIEAILIALAKQLFRARYVEWRALNTTMANAIAFWCLTRPGDTVLVQAMEGGGNVNYHRTGIPGLRGLVVEEMAVRGDAFEIDAEEVRRQAQHCRPRMLVVGGSQILFPYPLRELKEIADELGSYILYDGTHVGTLIAAEMFQDPLLEGATVLSLGTQKLQAGPPGSLSFTNDRGLAEAMLALTFPTFLQGVRGLNRCAAGAYALTEIAEFGPAYAAAVIRNARALGQHLEDNGFPVIARDRGYTATHQIFLDLRSFGAAHFEERCQAANILLHKAHMCGDGERGVRTGARISVQEVTRRGMGEPQMAVLARLIRRVTLGGESPDTVATDVEALVAEFPTVKYSFDELDSFGSEA